MAIKRSKGKQQHSAVVITMVSEWFGVAMSTTWHLKSVIGPDGRRLTLADLPPIGLKRWYPQHKACIATAVRKGLIGAEEVCKRYRLTMEELQIWQHALDRGGVKGLRASGKNLSRSAHSRRAIAHDADRDGEGDATWSQVS
jgi:hypothetical protein